MTNVVLGVESFPCPKCGVSIQASTEMSWADTGENAKGQTIVAVSLDNMEIIGGSCEHSEELRNLVVFEIL